MVSKYSEAKAGLITVVWLILTIVSVVLTIKCLAITHVGAIVFMVIFLSMGYGLLFLMALGMIALVKETIELNM